MNTEKMGQFISELRKSHQMTQKELAEKMNVSDKAVSKWERGLSCPDISLLSPLSELLGITASELLNGERAGSETVNVEKVVIDALEYGEKSAKRKLRLNQSILSAAFSILLLLGIFVVLIVDIAISRSLTWSLIPIAASIFAWLVFIPVIQFGGKGIVGSLISLSVFSIPFLYVLDYVIDRFLVTDTLLFDMGVRVAPLAIVFIWVAYLLFKTLKTRILLVISILILLSSPLNYFTNSMIARMLDEPYNGIDVVLNIFPTIITAVILFVIDSVIRVGKRNKS